MVVGGVEGPERVVRQRGDRRRIAARLAPVAGVGQQHADGLAREDGLGIGEDALHLAVDDAVEAQGAGRIRRIGGREMVRLAREGGGSQQRVEDGVEVDIGQVEEILLDVAADGVVGRVVAGHRVDEGGHRHLDHLEEGLLDRKLLGARQHHVLEDVGHAGVVRRRRGEVDGEGVLRVVAEEVQHAGAAGDMLELARHRPQLLDGSHGDDTETPDLVAGLEGDGWLRHGVCFYRAGKADMPLAILSPPLSGLP